MTACERFHDCGDIFRKASAPVYAGTPAGDLGFACLFLERRLGQALGGRALQGRVTEVQGCAFLSLWQGRDRGKSPGTMCAGYLGQKTCSCTPGREAV